MCARNAQNNAPARRLALKTTYTTKSDKTLDSWIPLDGDENAQELNSLVDFLEGKDPGWAAQQAQRYVEK